ncbi:hypothetical protein JAAARDRAFT_132646 [Jaapia argillacea MUCL 33604]|uniref:Vesicle tethering protein Uso1/P115-like head domain-containing protein n=1 Tax=Jaapia argillacea MUCL 33604 TaxID=933084 RepID=A0A067PR29_9AGAM|nr:hypothetical protein JAAARDRAFT_132646 [Jaapia argillacea MUCL 33604]
MEFLSQTYTALRGPTSLPPSLHPPTQSSLQTITKLTDRLSPSTLLADRRAAILTLKGLARDPRHRAEVGEVALHGLLGVLCEQGGDVEVDPEAGKGVLETLGVLCDAEGEGEELAMRHTDLVLAESTSTDRLFYLLAPSQPQPPQQHQAHALPFYTRYAALQLLHTLLKNRRTVVQKYFLKASSGPGAIVGLLEDRREIIRNESLHILPPLLTSSPPIQSLLAFSGVFESLFGVVTNEGGIEGGVVVEDALRCVEAMLRFNGSNQAYFSSLPLPKTLLSLLLFPTQLQQLPAPQEFSLQFWDAQKAKNASLVVSVLGMLVGGGKKGNVSVHETLIYSKCLLELALSSNAPTSLKIQALPLLPPTLPQPLTTLLLTPYLPVPETNGEEWDRLEPESVAGVLVELVVLGEYGGILGDGGREGLELRAAGATVFENLVSDGEIRFGILQSLLPSNAPPHPTPLLHALSTPPTSPINQTTQTSTHFSTLLFSHLVRSSPKAKTLARNIKSLHAEGGEGGGLFVPADGTLFGPAAGAPPVKAGEEEEEGPETLLQLLSEYLSLAFLERGRVGSGSGEAREWDRLICAYLSLLAQWLWEDSKSVKEFLDAGGLGVLVEPINQTSESDEIVSGLCVFLLGICYEFNREPGEIARSTIHPILNRLGTDTLLGRMSRLREDERVKGVSPESIVLPYPHTVVLRAEGGGREGEIWFDWAFVDFFKSNYYTIQKGLGSDPNSLGSSTGQNVETAMLVASLREVIKSQAQEIENLNAELKKLSSGDDKESEHVQQVTTLTAELRSSEEKRKDGEKEQEDLLVLLDEISSKRRKDKERMKEAGLEVSEDEGDDEDEEDEEDEDEE